jgi:hypothetical protein
MSAPVAPCLFTAVYVTHLHAHTDTRVHTTSPSFPLASHEHSSSCLLLVSMCKVPVHAHAGRRVHRHTDTHATICMLCRDRQQSTRMIFTCMLRARVHTYTGTYTSRVHTRARVHRTDTYRYARANVHTVYTHLWVARLLTCATWVYVCTTNMVDHVYVCPLCSSNTNASRVALRCLVGGR